ncbi:hypothetical protein H6P81_003754 [Aristolochia fimbriata]|uniref:Uncharacterized protein n=1 Tax=Aristolochia fimbriata TaxID=158543 RepID=A0AAV7FEJ5_ARIFI|nr:hypothetical protein H6P81_003754 [Aristolochia fimbriata]
MAGVSVEGFGCGTHRDDSTWRPDKEKSTEEGVILYGNRSAKSHKHVHGMEFGFGRYIPCIVARDVCPPPPCTDRGICLWPEDRLRRPPRFGSVKNFFEQKEDECGKGGIIYCRGGSITIFPAASKAYRRGPKPSYPQQVLLVELLVVVPEAKHKKVGDGTINEYIIACETMMEISNLRGQREPQRDGYPKSQCHVDITTTVQITECYRYLPVGVGGGSAVMTPLYISLLVGRHLLICDQYIISGVWDSRACTVSSFQVSKERITFSHF